MRQFDQTRTPLAGLCGQQWGTHRGERTGRPKRTHTHKHATAYYAHHKYLHPHAHRLILLPLPLQHLASTSSMHQSEGRPKQPLWTVYHLYYFITFLRVFPNLILLRCHQMMSSLLCSTLLFLLCLTANLSTVVTDACYQWWMQTGFWIWCHRVTNRDASCNSPSRSVLWFSLQCNRSGISLPGKQNVSSSLKSVLCVQRENHFLLKYNTAAQCHMPSKVIRLDHLYVSYSMNKQHYTFSSCALYFRLIWILWRSLCSRSSIIYDRILLSV